MKKLIGVILAACLVISAAGCMDGFYRYKSDPPLAQYEGEIKAPGLRAPVKIYRDRYAVPHIIAENEHDMFFAAGFIHAQDPLWEMMLFRAVAEGRTAELLGKIKIPGASFKGFPIDTVAIDKQQRSMGMKYVGEAGEALLKEYEPEIHMQLEAYSNGINRWIELHPDMKDLPVEFQILKTKPRPWRPADVISFGRLMGFILCYNMLAELLRTALIAKYDEDLAWAVAPVHDNYGPTIVPLDMLHNKLDEPRDLPPGGKPSMEELGSPPVIAAEPAFAMLASANVVRRIAGEDLPFASNNWILSPKLTTTGHAMLGNDTHMPHMQPSIWYMAHMKCPGVDVSGAMFPGVPYITLGHTRGLAWSATTSIADVQDLYVETTDPERPGMYKYKGEWIPFTTRTEKFCVRRIPTDRCKWEEVEIRQGVHGPILTDYLPLPEDSPAVALRWTAWDFSRDQRLFHALSSSSSADEFMEKARKIDGLELNNIAMAMDRLMKGQSIDDFIAAMDLVDLPNQNWMAVDGDGNIAYLPGGLVPIRGKGVGAIPVPGESGEFDWTGFIPTDELPRAVNPERGYMASANNEAVDAEWYPYLFDLNYDSGWRAWRVEELIEELKPIDMDDMVRMQNDVYAKKAEIEVPMILAAIERKKVTDPQVLKAYRLLKEWNYEADLDSPGCTIFFKYAHTIRAAIFKDEVSEEDFDKYLSESHIEIAVETLLKKGEHPLFDDKTTPDVVEDMDDVLVKSIKDSMVFIEDRHGEDPENWKWGDVHVMKWFHPLGFGPLEDLSVGTWPHVGSRHTIRNASPADSGRWHFKAMYGPAWRHLIDMGDVEQAKGIIDGSVSGQYLSPHYRDLHTVWLAGDHLDMTMDVENVKKEAKYELTLSP